MEWLGVDSSDPGDAMEWLGVDSSDPGGYRHNWIEGDDAENETKETGPTHFEAFVAAETLTSWLEKQNESSPTHEKGEILKLLTIPV
ncbi:hypothetical protein QE152_g6292 [Popillia japonica]|uniref:Uncharacterized protein n=1 Tax=Popillia japonica TaxID=7064 RepID=A0AAW1MIU6_POPJA